MEIQGLYAASFVKNIASSCEFYPDDKPMDTLIQWRGFRGAGIQLFQDSLKAGKGIMTLVVPDLVATKSLLHSRGIEIDQIREGKFGKIAHINDSDGNVITLAEPPKSVTDEEGNNSSRHA